MNARAPLLYQPAGKEKGKTKTLALLCLMVMGTGACGYAPSLKKVPAEPPPEHLRKPLNTSISVQEARDLAKPAKKSDGFGNTPHIRIGDNANMKGLKTDSLFSEKISNDDKRFERLESAVDDLHADFKSMKPAIDHLMSIEKDMKDLMRQLQIVINKEHKHTNSAPIIKTSNISSDVSITNMRIADHNDKTRIVLETSHNISYSASLDPDGNALTLSFDKGQTSFSTSNLGKTSNLISEVISSENGGGSDITIKLSAVSDILRQGRLPPSADKPYHRIFIDLER